MIKRIINLVDVENADVGGGKFEGIVRLNHLIKKYNEKYESSFKVPETFCIPVIEYNKYKKNGGVSNELLNEAMMVVAKCGGNVAVRSSADIEDGKAKSYSGLFETVLNVKTKKEMKDALNKVYKSAENVEGARMGIIIQPMINEPNLAGVIYSETWYGDPFVVMNYVENRLADDLVSRGGNGGKLFAVSKALFDINHKMVRLNLETVDDVSYKMLFYKNVFVNSPEEVTLEDRKVYGREFLLSALVMQLEQDLGYPVDMEFVVSKNGEFNILQQRPYIFPNFYERKIDKNTTTYFSLEKNVIEGRVAFINDFSPIGNNENYEVNIWKKDESVRIFSNKSVGIRVCFMGFRENTPFVVKYNHCGNMERENLDFREMETFGREKDFEHIKEGDYMRVDLVTGDVRVVSRENKELINLFWKRRTRS